MKDLEIKEIVFDVVNNIGLKNPHQKFNDEGLIDKLLFLLLQ